MAYKAIWLLLQICFTIYHILRQLCCRHMRQLALRSYDRQRNRSKEEEQIFLKKCELSKLPHHVSIIIGPEEDLEEESISRIISYAFYMNIDFISFYDTRLGKRRCDLHNLELPEDVRVKQLGKRHFLWTLDKSHSQTNCLGNGNTNGYKNGLKADHFIQIFEVKSFQGHALIGDVCRNLFKRRESNEIREILKKRTLLSQYLDNEMSVRLWKCRDPELCIIFSKYMCTFGMLPWQMRFTEFHLHQQGNLFDARTFVKILFQYAKCEQRWGK